MRVERAIDKRASNQQCSLQADGAQQRHLTGTRTIACSLLLLLFQFLSIKLLFAGATAAANTSNGTSSSKPIWQRPGCYQVGHTRTISIPGCVKFNLSTNACRGYCMSFSIPAAEDIGPPASDSLDEFNLAEASDLITSLNGNSLNADPERLMLKRGGNPTKRHLGTSLMSLLEGDSNHHNKQQQQQQFQEFHQLSGQQSFNAATSEKRDVISVGQCCNMMETEDVTVNLRCGFNETRRLVFKSAKTCECFFCKHV